MSVLTVGRFVWAGLSGADAVVDQIGKTAVRITLGSRKADDDAGARLVEAMREDAPRDTGGLVAGIEARREGGATVVQASATRESGRVEWDYAPFVEFGTQHTLAQPFFYPNVNEIMGERAARMQDLADEQAF